MFINVAETAKITGHHELCLILRILINSTGEAFSNQILFPSRETDGKTSLLHKAVIKKIVIKEVSRKREFSQYAL